MMDIEMKLFKSWKKNSYTTKMEKKRDGLKIFFGFRRNNFDLERRGRSWMVNKGENEFNRWKMSLEMIW